MPPGLAQFAVVLAVLCLAALFRGNVTGNELTKLIEAKAYANPDWIPGLFPAGAEAGRRQWLFQALIGPLLRGPHGFLAASLVGRLAAYLALAGGLAAVARALGLSPAWTALLVIAMDRWPSMIAGEWVIGGVEPKVFSYGLVLLALAPAVRGQRPGPAVAAVLGLATSMHVLVGLYGTLAVAAAFAAHGRMAWPGTRRLVLSAVLFFLTAALAIRPIVAHLQGIGDGAGEPGGPPGSYLYAYLRVPHHVVPATWPLSHWAWPVACLILLVAAARELRLSSARGPANAMLGFAAGALGPFIAGLAIAPFDAEGRWLQYYPFRFADAMVPFAAFALTARALDAALKSARVSRAIAVAAVLALVPAAIHGAYSLRSFPGPAQGVRPEWRAVCEWARAQTPPDALFVVPPVGSESFPWLARRRSFATFKQVWPSGGLPEWHRRLSALADWSGPWPCGGWAAAAWLAERYDRLDRPRLTALAHQYRATHIIRSACRPLDWPPVYTNAEFGVWTLPPP